MCNKKARIELKLKFGARCLATGYSLENCRYDFHHLEKKVFGGDNSPENGVLIIQTVHRWLHNKVEHENIETYDLINECFQLYKKCLEQGFDDLAVEYETNCMPKFRKVFKELDSKEKKKNRQTLVKYFDQTKTS